MLTAIRNALPTLRRSEQKVAAAILASPQLALAWPVAELARRAGVSAPTVLRFCQALGCDGFPAFKLELAQALGREQRGLRYAARELRAADAPAGIAADVIDGAIDALRELRERLDPEALERAVALLARARRVEVYGLGGNGVIAADAQLKFARLGLAASAYADPYLHRLTATLLGPDDVVVAVSNTGGSADLIASVIAARDTGAGVIAITAAGSRLAEHADVVLASNPLPPGSDAYAPIRARIVPMVIIDALAVGVALALGPAALDRLDGLQHTLQQLFAER